MLKELKKQAAELAAKIAELHKMETQKQLKEAKKKFPASTIVIFMASDGVMDWEETWRVFHPEGMEIPTILSHRQDHGLWDLEDAGAIAIVIL